MSYFGLVDSHSWRPGVAAYVGGTAPGSVELLPYGDGPPAPPSLLCWLEREVIFARHDGRYRYPLPPYFTRQRAADWLARLSADAMVALWAARRLELGRGGWSWWVIPGDRLSTMRPLILHRGSGL